MPKRKRDEEDESGKKRPKTDETNTSSLLQTLFSPIRNAYHWASDIFDDLMMRQYLSIDHAIQSGDLSAVRGFFKDGADIHKKSISMEHTLLHQAAARKNVEIVRFLIKQGANVNAPNSIAATPLHIAAGCGHVETVRLLLENGADFNIRSGLGVPLSWATSRGRVDVVRLLLDFGANPNGAENDPRPPIVLAAENGYPHIVRLLQQHGAILPEILRMNGAINHGQSVHAVSVHENVSKSAVILQNHYQMSEQEIAEAHRELTTFVDKFPSSSDKPNAAKRGLNRLSTLEFVDLRSNISLHKAIALVWKGLTDPQELMRKRKERGLSEHEKALSLEEQETLLHREEQADLQEIITDWFYQTQRNYNVSENGVDNQGNDSASCPSGCFNISIYVLNGRHPLVNIPVVNEAYIAAQVPILANQAFDDLTAEERAEYAKTSRDEISPALLTRLRQLIEPVLHAKFDEFQSDGLNVNRIIRDALETIEYVRITRLEDILGKQEKEEKQEEDLSPASPSSRM